MANYDPVYISISDKPRAILSAMDNLLHKREENTAFVQRRRPIVRLLFLVGLALIAIDLLLGYGQFYLGAAGILTWIAAIVMSSRLNRARSSNDFSPLFKTAHEVIYTLRDDLSPGRNFLGQLDLTGSEQASKAARETHNALGLTVAYYRDEWLSLKAKLYDGNMLRLSAVHRIKVRKGYFKRGRISGKQKWKPPKYKGDVQDLNVRIAVSPQAYDIGGVAALKPGTRIGAYSIVAADTGGGIVSISARTMSSTVTSADVLALLRAAYDLLKRKAQA
jgi:hypothetical protein